MIKINVIKKVATSGFYRGTLLVKKHSPELLLGAGIVGVVTSTVMACKATLRLNEIKEGNKEIIDEIHSGRENLEERLYSNEEYKRDLTVATVQGGMEILKLYAPSVILGAVSIGSLIGSHHILSKRNVALLGAYNLLNTGFQKYRSRVINAIGQEGDTYFRFGGEEKKFTLAEEKKKRGRKKEEKEQECDNPPCMLIGEESIYAKYFDDSSPQWRKDNTMNLFFLKAQQNYANDLLNMRGHVFLNEVYDMIGIPRTKEGAIVGWVKDHGDNFVDFNVHNPINDMNRDFVNGYAKAILLDFNVDGVIYDLI